MVDTETYTIEDPDGNTNTVELPEGLVDVLSEQGEEPAGVVGDITTLAFAQRAHTIVHHSQEEVPQDLQDMADEMEDLFEERFGVSFGEATGHQH